MKVETFTIIMIFFLGENVPENIDNIYVLCTVNTSAISTTLVTANKVEA